MPDHIRLTTCTVQRASGAFCDAASAKLMPFPICAEHARRLYLTVKGLIEALPWETQFGTTAEYEARQERFIREEKPLVYYVNIGDLIKIGTTVNLARRMMQYPPNAVLLGTEPGSYSLERDRHIQFAHLRLSTARAEWFEDCSEIRDHIKSFAP